MPGKPAARVGDMTAHGGTITGPGVPTVLIGKMPAATMGDMHVCPMMIPGTPPIPHVGGPIILGSTGVFIGKKPAARMGDSVVCGLPPSSIILGCMTVLIGEAGSGSQAGSAASAAAAAANGVTTPGALKAMEVPKPAESKVESHAIDLEFNDAGGKPIKGVVFRMKDPNGQMVHGASDSNGKWHSGAYSKAGSATVTVLCVHSVTCDKAKLAADEVCKIKAKADGYADGEVAMVYISLVDAEGLVESFDLASGTVRGGEVEIEWTMMAPRLERAAISRENKAPFEGLLFQVVVGFQCARTKQVELVVKSAALKIQASLIEVPDTLFHHDSAVPCLDSEGILAEALSYVINYAADHPSEELVILGHADTSGKIAYNYDLSEKRAVAVKSILDLDVVAWMSSAGKQNKVEDIQACLKSLASSHQWSCDPGAIDGSLGPKTEKAIQAFQQACNNLYHLGLTVDGKFTAPCWQALHRVICGKVSQFLLGVQDTLTQDYPTWNRPHYGYSDGDGVYPCSESFPIEQSLKDNYRSKTNRRIEFAFIPKGRLRLVPPKDRAKKLTSKECAIYDSAVTSIQVFPDPNRDGFHFSD